MRVTSAALLALLVCSSGCATIVTGGGQDQSVRVASTPKGADVYVDDQLVGQTPMSLRLTRKDDHFVRVQKAGYTSYEKTVKSRFNGWMFGNILFGGIIGVVVDAVSGTNPALSPTNINAKLRGAPGEAPSAVPSPTPSRAPSSSPSPGETYAPWADPRYTGATPR